MAGARFLSLRFSGLVLIATALVVIPLLWLRHDRAAAAIRITQADTWRSDVGRWYDTLVTELRGMEASAARLAAAIDIAIATSSEDGGRFAAITEAHPDGILRTRKAGFDDRLDCAIWIPPYAARSDDRLAEYLGMAHVLALYGSGSVRGLISDAYAVTADGANLLYWPGHRTYIWDASIETDYRESDWINVVRPQRNPQGLPAWTPPIWDPAAGQWWLGLSAPIHRRGAFAGCAGHDIVPEGLLSAITLHPELATNHLMLLHEGRVILSNRVQARILAAKGSLAVAAISDQDGGPALRAALAGAEPPPGWLSTMHPLPVPGLSIAAIGRRTPAMVAVVPSPWVAVLLPALAIAALGLMLLAIDGQQRRRRLHDVAVDRARLRAVFDGVQDALLIHDLDGRIAEVNPAMLVMFRCTRDQAVGRTVADFSAPGGDLPRLVAIWHDLVPGQAQRLPWMARRQDASQFPIEVVVERFTYDGAPAVVASVRDTSKRDRLERTLRALAHTAVEEDVFPALVRAVAEVFQFRYALIAEVEGGQAHTVATWASGAPGPELRYPLAGTPCAEATRSGACQVASGAAERFPDDALLRDMGVDAYIGLGLFDGSGTAIGLLAALHDAPVETDPELVDLLRLFAERATAELVRRRALDERRRTEVLATAGQLAGSVAHDFNNVLSVIAGSADLIALRSNDSRVGESVRMIHKVVGQAGALTGSLLRFVRRGEEVPQVYDAHLAIADALGIFSGLPVRQVRLERRLLATSAVLRGWPMQLQNAVLNLCLNARDAMPRGGTLTIETSNLDLDHAACVLLTPYGILPGPVLRLTIADSGTGMTTEVMARCREPFFTTKGDRGTGLGLPAVHGTAVAHHGALAINSTLGAGSAFTLYLPLNTTTAAYPTPTPGAAPAVGGMVLVVDDDPLVRTLMNELLTVSGFRCVALADGADVVAWCGAHPGEASLVLMDLAMPGIDGLAASRELHRHWPVLPIIIASGSVDHDQERALHAVGVHVVLTKPVRHDVLLAAVRTALMTDG